MVDRLEQVLAELEVLDQKARDAPGPAFEEWAAFDDAVSDSMLFLLAKLRAALEMGQHYGKHPLACPKSDEAVRYDCTEDAREGCTCGKDEALAAWQQAGEQP